MTTSRHFKINDLLSFTKQHCSCLARAVGAGDAAVYPSKFFGG